MKRLAPISARRFASVRIARHEPFELRTRKRAHLVCWGVMPSGLLRHPLFIGWPSIHRQGRTNSLSSDLRCASGKTLQTLRSTENARSRYAESDDGPNGVPNGVLVEPVIKRILRGLFPKQRLTYFEIESTDGSNFLLRTLTPEAQEWSEKFLAEPRPNGDRIVSGAIVAAVAAEAIQRGYLVQFV